jgi:uncharacterized protein involved in exopolysaccharide biosynthesis
MSAARTELANIEQQIVAAEGAVNAMRGQLAATPQNMPGMDGSAATASGRIAGLEAQINQSLARGWTEQHPDVVAIRQQITRLRPAAAAERRSGTAGIPNPAYVSLRAMMAEREAALAAATGAPRPDPVGPCRDWARASRPNPVSPPSRRA